MPQTIDLVSFQDLSLNVILALDVSASVSGERLQHLQGAGQTLLSRLSPDDSSALITIGHSIHLREALTGETERVRQALAVVKPVGDTALVDGTYTAMTMDPQNGGRNLLLVFSDGIDTASFLTRNASWSRHGARTWWCTASPRVGSRTLSSSRT